MASGTAGRVQSGIDRAALADFARLYVVMGGKPISGIPAGCTDTDLMTSPATSGGGYCLSESPKDIADKTIEFIRDANDHVD
ncbi:hypothetical protein A8144_09850 [Mycobacterium leprae 3125609]|nr:hypothetical protein A8144_09850 [Mycobacterium leprae 3125609]OAX70849.1 hypothetical protein A3216_09630 [Mycobacterium leprae 7935681]